MGIFIASVSSGSFLEMISQPWHWLFSGLMISLITILMTYFGRKFGVSSIFESACTVAGAGKKWDFFKVDLKDSRWRYVFIFGSIVGGFIASQYLVSPEAVAISESTITHLSEDFNMNYPQGHGFLPTELFNLANIKGIIIALIGGFLVGFGSRYGKGCTSGHAITGLSHLQLPSLLTVIGFFIGGLIMTWFILPFILG